MKGLPVTGLVAPGIGVLGVVTGDKDSEVRIGIESDDGDARQ